MMLRTALRRRWQWRRFPSEPLNPPPPPVPWKPLVYVAGPLSLPEPMENVHSAVKVATRLRDSGLVVPFVPHTSCLWNLIDPAAYETWLDYDFDVIRHCDALLRLDGESRGADKEVTLAYELDIDVFFSIDELFYWAERTSLRRDAIDA